MTPWPGGRRRLFRLPWTSRAQIEAEVGDEFEFHLRSRADELEATGVSRGEARRMAELEFGDAATARAYCRDAGLERERVVRRREWLGEWRMDAVYLARNLLRTPGAAITIVLMLGIALGVNLITFTATNELLFQQLPVADPGSLVLVHGEDRQTHEGLATSIADFRDLSGASATLVGLGGFNGRPLALGTDGTPTIVPAQVVTANYFDLLGLAPALGRFFSATDDAPGVAPVAVISHFLWTTRFDASPAVIGSPIRINGQPATVIGVTPPGFSGTFTGFRFDLFVPLGVAPALDPTVDMDDRAAGFLELFGRLQPEAARSAAGADLTRRAAEINRAVAAHHDRVFVVVPMTGLDTELESGVMALAALVLTLGGMGLLVASLNAGGLLLARGMTRQREFALRQALGAGRWRLIRLQLSEAAVLVGAAVGIGLLVSLSLRQLILSQVTALSVPMTFRLGFDHRVVTFLIGVAVVAILTTGLAPALATTRADVAQQLRGGGTSGRGGRLRRAFLSLQVAVTFALLVGAGLLARALQSSGEERIGATRQVAALHLDLTFADYDDDAGRRFYDDLIRRVRGLTGVEAAAYAARLPFGFGGTLATVAIPGFDPPDGQEGFRLDVNRISDGWTETVQVPVTRGRGFAATDRADGPAVALVNETMARRFWPDDDPLQRPLVVNGRSVEVVGVVDDARFAVPGRPDMPRIYVSTGQVHSPRAVLLVRAGPQGAIGRALVQAVSELGPDVPIGAVGTLAANINTAYLPQRLLGGATLAIATLTLMLAAFGLYGLLAYWVTTRRLELGIRSALGARSNSVVALAIQQGLVPTTWGVLGGVALAVGVGFVLRRFLLGVSPLDPIAYLIAAAVFYAVATVACLVPARRAAAVSPMTVLRGS